MNQKKTIFSILFLAGILSTSCEKEDPIPDPVQVVAEPSMSFSAVFNGQSISVPVVSINTTTSGNTIDVHAIKDQHYFNLYLTDSLKKGSTYTFEEGGIGATSFIYRDNNNLSMVFRSQSGSMTVMDLNTTDRTMKGTFNCVVKADFIDSTHTLAGGQFKIRY